MWCEIGESSNLFDAEMSKRSRQMVCTKTKWKSCYLPNSWLEWVECFVHRICSLLMRYHFDCSLATRKIETEKALLRISTMDQVIRRNKCTLTILPWPCAFVKRQETKNCNEISVRRTNESVKRSHMYVATSTSKPRGLWIYQNAPPPTLWGFKLNAHSVLCCTHIYLIVVSKFRRKRNDSHKFKRAAYRTPKA